MFLNLDSASALTERLIKLASIAAIAFTVVMGVSYRAGTRWGRTIGQRRREREGKPNLKRLAEEESYKPFWKDEALIQGGLKGIQVVAILCLYVISMLAFVRPSPADIPQAISVLMTFPNSMVALFVVPLTVTLKRSAGIRLWLITLLSIGAAAVTWIIGTRTHGGPANLAVQFVILTLQSLCVCYLVGVYDGISSANFESRFPLVDVITLNGQTIEGLRMLSSADTECRFVGAGGEEYLMPKEQIRMIRAKGASSRP